VTEQYRVGADYLGAASALLRRVRVAHPTEGLFEAADLQWWWRVPRSTDDLDQLFWFDDDGPVAAVIITEWSDWVSLDPIVMPGVAPDRVAFVVERGLAHAAEMGFIDVQLEVGRADRVLREVLHRHGFVIKEIGVVESWLAADARPAVARLPDGYRSPSRVDTMHLPHHMIGRSGPDVERRLRETSLYRPDLDLVVLDDADRVAACGLFWYDPETATGLVEPMRTEDEHQQRGLARHVLTTGIALLAEAGAERIKICFEPHNPASSQLYLSVGFEPVNETDVFAGRTVAIG
jgi:RimJ/RimL family protein N-acetyltransferase